jgi:hypothetical protein
MFGEFWVETRNQRKLLLKSTPQAEINGFLPIGKEV